MKLNKEIRGIFGLDENSERVCIEFKDGSKLIQTHHQDCCEYVRVSQIDGDIKKHRGATAIELKEKIVMLGDDDYTPVDKYEESATATFYTLVTSKGYLDWRWQGESNGYYSEDVHCIITDEN